jgi:hypothetical protein
LSTHKKILCLDFDGVIHSYSSGWQGARNIPDPPTPGAIRFLIQALAVGFDVVIHSSRGRYFGGRRAMRAWLKRHAGAAWYPSPAGPGLENVRFPLFKPPAHVTIDDRVITFTGQWPAMSYLKEFKPFGTGGRYDL